MEVGNVRSTARLYSKELEEGLFKSTGERITLEGAGRTDSGVHARGQVANFYTGYTIPSERFALALNAVIPSDIHCHSEEVDLDFHSRFGSGAENYRYSTVIGTMNSHRRLPLSCAK